MAKMLKMFLPCEVKSFDDKALIVEHFISTESEDRSGDEVDPEGMVLEGTPSVLKQHGADPDVGSEPIARCLSLVMAKNENGARGIRARTQYYDGSSLEPPDNTGRRLYEKAKGGFMPYWSIGFIPYVTEPKQGGGRRIKRWSLVEYSQVGVPDNAEAKGFNPSDAGAVLLDGAVEHRKIDGVDIDAQYTEAYLKHANVVEKGWMPVPGGERIVRAFNPESPICELKSIATKLDRRIYHVQYQKHEGRWSVHALHYPESEGWTEELAQKHTQHGEIGPWVTAGAAPLEPYVQHNLPDDSGGILVPKSVSDKIVKSFTDSLNMNAAYGALQLSMESLLGEVLYRSERPKEREVRGLVKEFSAFVETNLMTILSSLDNMEAEQATKTISILMERKTAATADSAPAAPEQPERVVTPPTVSTSEATRSVAEGVTEAVTEEDAEQFDFEVQQTGGDSSPSDGGAAADEIVLDTEELKSFVRAESAAHVRREINKLRGRLE